jgi:small subunit ribosomal protein S12
MPTYNQLVRLRSGRIKKFKRTSTLDLNKCPQKKAYCLKILILSPKKPNSARRKAMWVYITSTSRQVFCYIPGIGHSLQKHSTFLIRGGRRRDLPGMKYTAIRGKLDFTYVLGRRSSRSKYGLKRPI